jgi:hypothetical protein
MTPKSNISYYITVDMELQKGTSLSPSELKNLKCRKTWSSIRKNYADLTGVKYVPLPNYSNLPSIKSRKENKLESKNDKDKDKSKSKSKTQKAGSHVNNKTRKRI